ncbi:MAG: TolC family protein, partial [Chitinophagaceae bacterium]
FMDEQIKQVSLKQKDIQIGIDKMVARLQNGLAFRSNVNELKAEYLQTEQRKIELNAGRKGLIETLQLFMNVHFSDSVVFDMPVVQNTSNDISRPELKLYADQSNLLEQQKSLVRAGNMPKASLFMQGGYGRPTFNFLKNDFDFFYIGGIRLTWPISGLYTRKNDLQLIDIDKKSNSIQEATFLLNVQTQLTQQQSEIDKMNALVESDQEIIELRESVKQAAKVQLENGVITSGDYMREVNAEDQARQALITHQVQLLQAKIYYQTIQGKKYE